jgi:hypothetical protein
MTNAITLQQKAKEILNFEPLHGFPSSMLQEHNPDHGHVLVFDTETPGLFPNNFIYDMGFVIVDKVTLQPVFQYNAAVQEVFQDSKTMTKAHFAHKLFTHYPQLFQSNAIMLRSWEQVVADIEFAVKQFNVDTVMAYNLPFDRAAFTMTSKRTKVFNWLKTSIENGTINFVCLWKACCNGFMQTEDYKEYCRKNGFYSAKGNIQTGAEIAIRYLKQEPDFIEDHTALSDAVIEAIIYRLLVEHDYDLLVNQTGGATWQKVNDKVTKAKTLGFIEAGFIE